jgi:hypothetical protein
MKVLLSVLILMNSIVVAYSQGGGRVIFWNGDPGCGVRTKSIAAEEIFQCSSVQTDRGQVSTVTHNGVTLSVAFLEDSAYNIVGAGIVNRSDEFVAFDAEMWGAAHFKTKAAFQARERPVVAETSISTRDILRLMATGIKYESSLDTFIADGQKTVETREVRKADGTRVKVDVVVPDRETQQATVRQNMARAEMVVNEQRRIRETALTARSVQPGSSVKGLVYFRRVSNAEFVVFSLRVGDTTFVFQLPRNVKG